MARSIVARYARTAAGERREAREAHDEAQAAARPPLTRAGWSFGPREGDCIAQLREPERQRVEVLALEGRRPMTSVGKGRAKRQVPVALPDDVERQLALREQYRGRQGTPQTHQHHEHRRGGALARLYDAGGITGAQLDCAVSIATVAERLTAGVRVRTGSPETRVDCSRGPEPTEGRLLWEIRSELAYDHWRRRAAALGPIGAVLDMVVGETLGYSVVARRYGMASRRAKALLVAALDLWPAAARDAGLELRGADLAAMQAGLI